MLDIGWSEMALILMVALIVIGPKDLPRVARTIGKWTGKARAMAREFQRSLDDMAREAELQDIKSEMDKLTRVDVRHRLEETIDPAGEIRRGLAAPDLHADEREGPEYDEPEFDEPDDDEPERKPVRNPTPTPAASLPTPAPVASLPPAATGPQPEVTEPPASQPTGTEKS